MQALSSYNPDAYYAMQRALGDLGNPARGLSAVTWLTKETALARFDWPDWPKVLTDELAAEVNEFRRKHLELKNIAEGAPEWLAVFGDSRPDLESASKIAEVFSHHFEKNRVEWVRAERDSRARIMAFCLIRDLIEIPAPSSTMLTIAQESLAYRAEKFPWVSLKLTWKSYIANPPGPLSDSDRKLLQASMQEISDWAASRIKPILRALEEKLSALYGDRFRGLYVFGSYARPDAGIELPAESDLDVALLLSDMDSPYEEIGRYSRVRAELSLEHSMVISIIPMRDEDFREGRTNFARVISEYALPVG